MTSTIFLFSKFHSPSILAVENVIRSYNNLNNYVSLRNQEKSIELMGAPTKFDHQDKNGATSSVQLFTTVFWLFIVQIIIIVCGYLYVQENFTTIEITRKLEENLRTLTTQNARYKRDADSNTKVSHYFPLHYIFVLFDDTFNTFSTQSYLVSLPTTKVFFLNWDLYSIRF